MYHFIRSWRNLQKPQDVVATPLTTSEQPDTFGRHACMASQLHPPTPPTSHSTCKTEGQFTLIPGQQAVTQTHNNQCSSSVTRRKVPGASTRASCKNAQMIDKEHLKENMDLLCNNERPAERVSAVWSERSPLLSDNSVNQQSQHFQNIASADRPNVI